jgi:hypothetical protein
MDLVQKFEAHKKKLEDRPKQRRQDKIEKGRDIAKFCAKEKTPEIDSDSYSEGWDRIFGKKEKSE